MSYQVRQIIRLTSAAFAFVLLLSAACTKEDPEAKYTRLMDTARQYVTQEKFEEARITLLSAIDLKPNVAEGYFDLAEVLVHLKQYPRAAESYLAALNADPSHRLARLHVASLYLLAREWEQAESHIGRVLEQNPKDPEALVLKAGISRARNRLDEADAILTEVLAANPKLVSAIASKGELAVAQNNLPLAEELFREALNLEPLNAPLRLALADLYTRENRLDEAQELLGGLVKGEPQNTGLRFFYGEFLLRRGLGDAATEQYAETLKADPLRHDARDRLYDMLITRGKTEEAKKLSAELIAQHPEDPGSDYFRGRDAELKQDNAEALKFYLKAVVGMPSFAPAFRRAGLFEFAAGNHQAGIEHLNQAVEIDPFDVGARLTLAQDAFARKDFTRAETHVNRVLERFPRQLGANILRADIALVQGKPDLAKAIYQVLMQAFPDSPVGYFKLGLLAESQKDPKAAIEWYKKGIALDKQVSLGAGRYAALVASSEGPGRAIEELQKLIAQSNNSKPELKTLLATVILSKGKPTPAEIQEARELLNSAIGEKADLIGAYYTLADLSRFQSNLSDAAKQYEQIVQAQPTAIPPKMLLAITYDRLGKSEQSKAVYQQILELSPRFAPAANNLAWIIAEHGGDFNEALRLAKIAKEELPKDASITDTLGWIYYKKGAPEDALPYIIEASELQRAADPRLLDPEILFHLGVLKYKLGDDEGAEAAFSEALTASNQDEKFKEKIQAVKNEPRTGSSNVQAKNP